MEKETCLLCFQDIETTTSDCDFETSYYSNNSYRQIIFESCKRLLGLKVNSFNWSHSPDNCSTYCLRCIHSSEKLWKIEEKSISIKNELENFIATFSNEILQSRLNSLSKNLEVSEIPSAEKNCEPLIVENTTISELDVESIKIEQFDDDSFMERISDGENEHEFPSSPAETSVTEDIDLQAKLPEAPHDPRTSNKFLEINRRQLKVTLQRLEIDSKGKVMQPVPDCIKGRLGKRKAAIIAKNSLLTKSLVAENFGDDIDDDEEFLGEDLNVSSDEKDSDSDEDKNKKKPKVNRKTKVRQMKRDKINGKILPRKLGNFKCVGCSDTFEFSRQLDNHSKETGHENKREFKCENCDRAYYRRVDLKVHQPTCNYVSKNCEYCDTFCPTYSFYYHHVRDHDEWKSKHGRDSFRKKDGFYQMYKCVECEATFKFNRDLISHSEESGHVNIPAHKCEHCSKKFYTEYHLKVHINEIHKINPKTCTLCNVEFATTSKYRSHMRYHNPKSEKYQENYVIRKMRKSLNPENTADKKILKEIPKERKTGKKGRAPKEWKSPKERKYVCPECKACFRKKFHLQRHIGNEHGGEKKFKCDQEDCKAAFACRITMYDHRKDHLAKTKVQCPICHWFYKGENRLNIHHQRAHSGAKRISCDSCSEGFNEMKDFVAHKIVVHGMKSPFVCRHCKTSFTYKVDLTLHLRSDHNENPNKEHMKCQVCEEQLNNPTSYLYHILRHTDIPNELLDKVTEEEVGSFLCEDCGRVFSCKKYLTAHSKRNHQERKKKECPICHKILVNKRTYSKHIRIHNEHTKVSCPICGRGFNENDQMRNHFKRIHEQNKIPRKPYTKTPFSQPKQFIEVNANLNVHEVTFSNNPGGRPPKAVK